MSSTLAKSCIMILLTGSFFLNSCVQSERTQQPSNDPFASLKEYGSLPEFTGYTDENKQANSSLLKSKTTVISFFFTSCGDICPKLNLVKSRIVKNHASESLRFISVTVDPLTDTPSHLREHRQLMQFTDKRWSFVRMDNDSILESFMNGMLIGYAENPQNHTARLILLDSKSRIRGYFDALDKQQVDSLESILEKVQ